jgi:hypothetical protein
VTFDLIFGGLLLAGWLICAYAPWVVASIVTRGHAGFAMLPLCLFSGVVGALAVPILGADGVAGLWASFGVAAAVPSILLVLQRAAAAARRTARAQTSPAPAPAERPQTPSSEHPT